MGKTEIARRLARLADAPFIKVEATKFTEVGYVGRDVDTIIRDLVEAAIKQTREAETRKVRDRAADAAEERMLDVLLPPAREVKFTTCSRPIPRRGRNSARCCAKASSTTRKSRSRSRCCPRRWRSWRRPGMEDLTSQMQGMFQQMSGGTAQGDQDAASPRR